MSAGYYWEQGKYYPVIYYDGGYDILVNHPKETADEAMIEARTIEAATGHYEAVLIVPPVALSIWAGSYKEATKKALREADRLSNGEVRYELDIVRAVE